MKRPHYYYAVAEDSETGKALQAFMNECAEADNAALKWAEDHDIETYYESPVGMAGGIVAVEFENTIAKEGWEKLTSADGRIMFVPEADTELEKEMFSLPVVSETKLIAILGFKQKAHAKDGKPLPFTFGEETPIVFLNNGKWYVDVPYECSAPGCRDITKSKFKLHQRSADTEKKDKE